MTLEEYEKIPDGEVFRIITTRHHHIIRINGGWPELLFACVKDDAHLWCIYYHYPSNGLEYVLTAGDKVIDKRNITELIPCDQGMLDMYRY